MANLVIFCFGHPAFWKEMYNKNENQYRKKLLLLNKKHSSWINENDPVGERFGIFKLVPTNDESVTILTAVEEEINVEFQSLEKIFSDYNEDMDGNFRNYTPRAYVTILLLDLRDGIGYAYSPKKAPKMEKIDLILKKIENDIGIPIGKAKIFKWDEDIENYFIEAAINRGYSQYKFQYKTDLGRFVGVGVLTEDFAMQSICEKIDSDPELMIKREILLLHKRNENIENFIFGLGKRSYREITIMENRIDPDSTLLLNRFKEIREIFESVLKKGDVRLECFPEYMRPLTTYFFNDKQQNT